MVHDSREQVVSKGARTFDRKWSKWRGRHPAATNLNSQFDRETSSARSFDFIQTTSPQIIYERGCVCMYADTSRYTDSSKTMEWKE
ncbi:hypothetical protein KIN20_032093 [Parelaphostrongylus tenuis]|uniref:Uncharacterized protein n=1 Tax=Parelaphostrongylus tenuis TaxID=148309 RepID=A0AAD5R6G5_PARTN|nr:hypothetical protein KIN20_032093 [Parelaphostrongylus tenuis]